MLIIRLLPKPLQVVIWAFLGLLFSAAGVLTWFGGYPGVGIFIVIVSLGPIGYAAYIVWEIRIERKDRANTGS